MKEEDTATSGVRQQLKKLEAELKQVMADRHRNEAAVEECRKRARALLAEGSEIAAEEGRLRQQITEIRTVLEGLIR